jgi:xylulokinase
VNTSTPELVIGVDVGTQGVRVIIADPAGQVVSQASVPFPPETTFAPQDEARFEQDPRQWWEATAACLRQATTTLPAPRRASLAALAVTATSGTICLLDRHGEPLHPAIMYSDQRATDEADWLNETGDTAIQRTGCRFQASSGLPRLLWLQRHHPDLVARARYFAHASDVLVGNLTGDYGVSDWSHALKTGYDLVENRWPDYISSLPGLPAANFPRIVPPGTIIGSVTPAAAAASGLPAGLAVVAGMTDGCTAQIAGGATEPGQWLSVLGTTLVIKGVTTTLLHTPHGHIYSHRHPAGSWLPGGASNTGGEVLARRFANANLATLDQRAARLTPTGLICYPLERIGERFPFARPDARGFLVGTPPSTDHHYTACLEGVGYVERLAYQRLAELGAAPIGGPLRVAGGGARSLPWLQIRADILNLPLLIPQQIEAAFGAAVLAASATCHHDLSTAARAMVHMRAQVDPHPHAERYTPLYQQFVAACRERDYLP